MKARVLSAVLAILMILAVCPMISLSAATTNVDVWNGKVAGTDTTLAEMKAAYDAGGYTAPTISLADIKSDLDYAPAGEEVTTTGNYDVAMTWNVNSAAGLAFWSAWLNGYVKTDWLNASNAIISCSSGTWGKTLKLTTDIDLNNQPWVAIGVYGLQATFVFDGDGHCIRNMMIQDTENAKNTRFFGLFGSFTVGATAVGVGVKNLALLDATIDVKAASNNSTIIGGLIATAYGTTSASVKKPVTVENCVVDVDIKLTTTYTEQKLTAYGDSSKQYGALVGGVLGYSNIAQNLQISNVVVNGNIEIDKAETSIVGVGGLVAGASKQPTGTAVSAGLLNVTVSGATASGSFGLSDVGGISGLYGFGESNAQTGIVTGLAKADVLAAAGANNPFTKAEGFGWAQEDGRLPIPAQFESIYDVVEPSLYDAFFNNLGASVRTKAGEAGLRFSVELSEALTALGATEYGLLIIPKNKLSGELTVDNTTALKVNATAKLLDSTNKDATHQDHWVFGNTSKQFNVALIGIPDANVNTDFVVRPYAVLGDGRTVYGNIMERNLVDVVEAIMTSGSAADQAAVYDAYKGNAENFGEKFNAYVPQA